MLYNIIITGVGGQGNVLASQILGRAAVSEGLMVTIGETFGLSQRGGSVMSHIRISDKKCYGPLIPPNMADVIVGLEPLETMRVVAEFGQEECVYIVNSRPIYPLNAIAGDMLYPDTERIRGILAECGRVFWIDATKLAVELGGPIMLNMIMLGALCSLPSFPVTDKQIAAVLPGLFPASKLEANYKALETGIRLMSDNAH